MTEANEETLRSCEADTSLMPFWVDDTWVDTLEPVQKYYSAYDDGRESDQENGSVLAAMDTVTGRRAHRRRELRRFSDTVTEQAVVRTFAAASRMVAYSDNPVAVKQDIDEKIRGIFAVTPEDWGMQHVPEVISLAIDEEAVLVRSVTEASLELDGEVREVIVDNPVAQYDLLKLLAGASKVSQDERGVAHSVTLVRMLHIAAVRSGEATVLDGLRLQLDAGQYDQYIAKDLLTCALNTRLPQATPLDKLRSLTHLVMYAGGTTDVEGVVERLTTSISDWPSESRFTFTRAHQELGSALLTVADMGQSYAKNEGFVTPAVGDEEDFNYHLQKYMIGLLSQLARHMERAKGAKLNAFLVKAKSDLRAMEKQPQGGGVERSERANAEKTRGPKELVCVTPDGDVHGRDSDAFRKVISGYLERYNNNPDITDDVMNALDALAVVEASKNSRGVKRYTARVRVGGKTYQLYGFKPSDVPTFKSKTEQGTRTRILFGRTIDKRVAIFSIVDRPKVDDAIKSLKTRN